MQKITVEVVLQSLRPNAQWVLKGSEYEGLEWLDEAQTKPTEKEVIAEIKKLTKEYDKTAKIQESSKLKQSLLANITVEVNGHTFDAREKDQARIMAALKASEVLGVTVVGWKLADNTVVDVDVTTLEMVLALGIQKVGEILKGE